MSVIRNNPELIKRLTKVQNHKTNFDRDIMSFAGFMTTKEELKEYVTNLENEITNPIPNN